MSIDAIAAPIEISLRASPALPGSEMAALEGAIRRVRIVHDMESPLQFQIDIAATESDPHAWADHRGLQPGTNLELHLGRVGDTTVAATGEITAVAASFDAGRPPTVTVTGYDDAHRLLRGTARRGFVNQDHADIARQIVRSAGLRFSGEKTGLVAPFIAQDNETDWGFLKRLADATDFDCYSMGDQVHFRSRQAGREPRQRVELGGQLVSFDGRLNTSRLVSGVAVTSWDPAAKSEITAHTKGESAGIGQGRGAPRLAGKWFGSSMIELHVPVVDRRHADALVQRELDRRSLDLVTGEAVVHGDARFRVGDLVGLSEVGERFGGTYQIRRVVHTASAAGGFQTELGVARNRIR